MLNENWNVFSCLLHSKYFRFCGQTTSVAASQAAIIERKKPEINIIIERKQPVITYKQMDMTGLQ